MFGYINVNGSQLSEENKAVYQSYYCGLCRRLKEFCGKKVLLVEDNALNREIAKEIYPYGSLFCGLFGTHPYALARYFKDNGFGTHMNKDYYTFKKNFAKHSFGVVSFWNGKSVFKGLHTVAVENFDGGVRVYNKSNKADCAVVFNTLDDCLDSERFICGYYVD